MKHGARALSILAVSAFACGDDPAPAPSLAERAEQVRELEMLKDVPIEHTTKDEFLEKQRAKAENITDEELDELDQTYGRLGYWSPDVDLRAIFTDSSKWLAAVYYDTSESIVVIGDVDDEVFVHEYVHALQDQHFDLGAYKDQGTSDAVNARRGVIEGDATLAHHRFLAEEDGHVLEDFDWAAYVPDLVESSRNFLAKRTVPAFFLAYPAFAYSYGFVYCAHNLMGLTYDAPSPSHAGPYDWSREDELFTERPPPTTLSVITLDEAPEAVPQSLDEAPIALGGRYEIYDADVLGAWHSYILFLPIGESTGQDMLSLASAWRGDAVTFLREPDDGRFAVLWTSTWKSAEEATRVETVVRTLHEIEPDASEPRLGTSAEGEPVWVEHSGDRLVFIANLDPDDAAATAEEVLSSTSTRSARRPGPLHGTLRRIEGRLQHLPD